MALLTGSQLGPYEVVGLLGAGGMGEAYRARDPRLGREVALKVLPPDVATEPDRLHRFEREARAVAALNHPHILTVYDVGTDDGRPYIVTELLEGETLREVLTRRTPTERQVLDFAVQAAQGLAAAHGKGLVHRDLKPENLFLTTQGRIKILDFGLAKLAASGAPLDTTGAGETEPTLPGVEIDAVAYTSPEQVQAHPVDARSDIFSLGVVLHELLSRRHPFLRETVPATLSAILRDTPTDLGSQATGISPAVSGIVSRCLEKRPEDRFQTAHDLALALEAVFQAPSGTVGLEELRERSPYPGLQSFTEKDAGVFFGREAEVEELWTRIRGRSLLAVIGPSGVGKTSFIRAGVVAHRPAGWGVLVTTPGAQPFRSLGRTLGPELVGDTEALGTLVDFEDPDTAFELLGRWRHRHDEALLVLDQFEELFTLNPPEVQGRFAEVLRRISSDADIHVLLSLRDDFLIRCHEHPALALVFERLTPLLGLSGEGLRRALVEPAGQRGYRFEDEGLVDEMVESVEGARAALPLLAFAVSGLWERRDREKKLLKRESYEAIGGVAGALAQHAEETLSRIGVERQGLVRELFRNLVTAQGTRAVADREELLSVFAEGREAADEVLGALVDSRLLTSYDVEDDASHSERALDGHRAKNLFDGRSSAPATHRIEIAHESLLKAWPRLVRWQAQDEEGAVLRDQLRQAAHLWEEKNRSPDVLWSGTALQEFELWRQRYPGQLSALEEDFARSMVERDRRRKRVRRALVAAAFAALAAVAAAMTVSRQQTAKARDEARDEALRAEASKLLALGQARLDEDPTEALAFATASLETADSQAAREFALKALGRAPPALEVISGEQARFPVFSRDGKWLAVGGHSTQVRVWPNDGGEPIVLPGHETTPRSEIWPLWTGSGFLVTGPSAGVATRLHVWALPEGDRLRTIELGAPSWWETGAEHVFAETPEGEKPRLSLLRSWRLPDGEAQTLGRIDSTAFTSSLFEPYGRGWLYSKGDTIFFRPLPDGRRAADRPISRHGDEAFLNWNVAYHPEKRSVRDRSGEIRLLSFTSGGPSVERVLPKPETAAALRWPSPSGRWLQGNESKDAEARIWDPTRWPAARPLTLRRSGSWYASAATFHPRDDWLVASTGGLSRLTFWPLRRAYPVVVDGYSFLSRPLAFSPDGRWLATGWPRQPGEPVSMPLRLWPLPGSGVDTIRTLPMPRFLCRGLAFDPAGRYVFAVGNADHALLVPLDGSPPHRLDGFSEDTLLDALAVSPSGRRVATAFAFGSGHRTLRVWDVDSGALRQLDLPAAVPSAASTGEDHHETGYARSIQSMSFVDEETLYTAGMGGVRRWDLRNGSHDLVAASAKPQHLTSMSASSDGRWALTRDFQPEDFAACAPVMLHDLGSRVSRPLETFGPCVQVLALDPSGTVAVTGDLEGAIRVGRLSGAEPHLLLGHQSAIAFVAVSPDLRWIASAGEDSTLRLWPMPNLDKPPLHTLPREELIAKLKSLTNIRAARDPDVAEGWSIQLDPFPGWKEVPEW